MKKLPAFLFATLLAATTSLRLGAAEPSSAFGLTPSKPDTLLPEGQGGLPLIPDNLPSLDQPPATKEKKEKKSTTSDAEDALRERIKLRMAKTKAQSDPELQALWDSLAKARTDYEYREILTKYYTQLCARMGKIDKTLKKENLDALREAYLSNFDQTRIAPTVPPEVARAR
jgi:hypothetical protein